MNRLVLCFAFALFAACAGGDDADKSNGTDADETEGSDNTDADETTFDCGNDACDTAAGEFCLLEYYATGELSTSHCIVADCNDCDCADEATDEYYDGASNCSGLRGCSQSNDEITVECTLPNL